MSQAQLTRLINWFALAIALSLLVLVGLHIYKKHILVTVDENGYLFNDLPTQAAAPLKADIQKIVQAHVMGEVPEVVVAKPVTKKDAPKPAAPKTKLNIRLTGVIDGATPESGFAMIEIQPGRTVVLGVGDAVGDTGAVLHQVLPGEVLVDREGLIESVKMTRSTLELAQQFPDTSLINLMEDGAAMASTNEVAEYSNDADITYDTSSQNSQSVAQQQLSAQQLAEARAAQAAQNNAASANQDNNNAVGKLPIPKKLLRL